MNFLIFLLTLVILNTGCSFNNGFSKFHMAKDQELSANSLQSSKIKDKDEICGVLSAVYLNEVYPSIYNTNEYFLVYYYLKDSFNNNKSVVLLNNEAPLKIEELESKNQFSTLIDANNEWTRYYLLSFKGGVNILNLKLKNENASSEELQYVKVKH